MILNELISTLLQLIVFGLVPFFFYVIKHRKANGFFKYIGLHGTTSKAVLMSLGISIVFLVGGMGLALFSESIRDMMHDPNSITGKFRQMGFSGSAVVILLMIAWVKTSLSEEIFFRGFIAKRLMNRMGMLKGNLLQAFIFGLLHLVLFLAITPSDAFALGFIFVFSGTAAFLIGYVKVKYGNGSIIPGWIAHGLGNMISYSVIGFLL